ncbi:acetyl-CoA C-acetyltransferase [Halalkalibacterium halodurans]|uniref:acetyl-CoA C-acetyltransferase n=1 Tax=Halalkalibacterium halodurans (strain ATCC BAA-125 / DSM 18197 / FERM 7344 / JCM 9153 / C-125) TaxID=272558 RepID=Q9KBD1_HALH5|nr:acetyl-CoA C-acetyltransferase [Halalkalibacterium halodurans]MDY7222556.1 acetyl-CoA C-acetyltransferase [Halalkalibacterium halodurans]MDY7241777.1 acetyl-CoA C-acetyltransferase [Halalkalibacterium halodurans]MED4123969.1 acetyl-CoA C-acetyltransferase [Halalkalibacterium halodurans]BAB05716.1 thiolase (acetyl-CoA acetyltransferase) [Halalkalibacterium halodurans C-125]
MKDVVILDGARTPFTSFGGSFREVSAIELGVAAAKEAIKRANVDPEEVDQTIVGNVIQSSSDAILMGRHVGLKAGVRTETTGLTINRLCGSGLQSILTAAESIRLGNSEVALAGGAENMSQIPHVIRGARWGLPLGQAKMEDYLWEALYDPYCDCTMAITAENLAEQYQITREEVDMFALRSHRLALESMRDGTFAKEIVAVNVKTKKGERMIDKDEHPRETTLEKLRNLVPRFKESGVVTPGNASGINDGAAMMIVSSMDYAERRNLKPLARLVSYAVVGVEPSIMGIGPAPAIQEALRQASMKIEDLDLVEINEAFAAQYLACQQELDFNPDIGNVNGGAIALGHPLGASGARITLSLIYELARRNKKYGVSAVCIGGGQGIAAIWERLH